MAEQVAAGAGTSSADRSSTDNSSPVTIYDIADVAGVAPSTVSRALSRPGRVSAGTVAKVREVADLLGYRRSVNAPPIGTAVSHLLAMVVSDIGNPATVQVIRGAQQEAEAAGYGVVLVDSQEDEVRELIIERHLPMLNGLLLTTPRLPDSGIHKLQKYCPLVVLNRVVPGLPSVITDAGRGARLAVDHLAALGHREVTYLAGPESAWTDGMRWHNINDAARAAGLHARRIGPGDPTARGGAAAAKLWSTRPTSAVIAFNDIMAIGFIRRLRLTGVSIPGEVSVVGFDNSELGALTEPSLTSIASPLRAQGASAVRMLLRIIKGQHTPLEPITLPVKIVVRHSTGEHHGA